MQLDAIDQLTTVNHAIAEYERRGGGVQVVARVGQECRPRVASVGLTFRTPTDG